MFDINTEYFNGYEWKRICDYTIGDRVLQFNSVLAMSHLAEPTRVIYEDRLEGFYSYNGDDLKTVLSDDHKILYKDKATYKEIKQKDILKGFSGLIPVTCFWDEETYDKTSNWSKDLDIGLFSRFINEEADDKLCKFYQLPYKSRTMFLSSIFAGKYFEGEDNIVVYSTSKYNYAVLVHSLLAFSNACSYINKDEFGVYSVFWKYKTTNGIGYFKEYSKVEGVSSSKKVETFSPCVSMGGFGFILPENQYLVCKRENCIFISGGY